MHNVRELRFFDCTVEEGCWSTTPVTLALEDLSFGNCTFGSGSIIYEDDPDKLEKPEKNAKVKMKVSQLSRSMCRCDGCNLAKAAVDLTHVHTLECDLSALPLDEFDYTITGEAARPTLARSAVSRDAVFHGPRVVFTRNGSEGLTMHVGWSSIEEQLSVAPLAHAKGVLLKLDSSTVLSAI